MSTTTALVRKLFAPPGTPARSALDLQAQAASVHARLLEQVCAHADDALARSLAPLHTFLHHRASGAARRRLLCHPLFIEGLHSLAAVCPELRHWHESVAADHPLPAPGVSDAAARAALGHVTFVCRLRTERHLRGEHVLCTDCLGRLGFPFSDWSLTLATKEEGWLAGQVVHLALHGDRACWRLAGVTEPFLILPRAVCRCLVRGTGHLRQDERLECPDPNVRPRWQCAGRLGHGGLRYDPVCFQDFAAHAALTGGLVQELLEAIRQHSPAIYREALVYLHTVRGFEFPRSPLGVVGSFSDPTLPGVMGINVPYTPQHEPCLEPFCFTWFGHELAHTKDYLGDTILYGCGASLLRNPGEYTDRLPRYNQAFPMRTLLQIPYTHLYEWTMLMDFWEGGFRGLPWSVPRQVAAVGEAFEAEIVEAFALIEERSQLTSLGGAALRHFRNLFSLVRGRWRSLRLSA